MCTYFNCGFVFLFTAALQHMLNLNTPMKSLAVAEPVWKVNVTYHVCLFSYIKPLYLTSRYLYNVTICTVSTSYFLYAITLIIQ